MNPRQSGLGCERCEGYRQRIHEIQRREDGRRGALERRNAYLEGSIERARERVKEWTADWTTHPPSKLEHGWWRYTSHNHAYEVIALVHDARQAADALELAASWIEENVPGASVDRQTGLVVT